MYRHRFHGSTISSFQDIIENMIFKYDAIKRCSVVDKVTYCAFYD